VPMMKRSGGREQQGFGAWRKRTLARLEEELLRKALKEYGGNITRTAKALGVHRSTLQRLMRRHDFPVGETSVTSPRHPLRDRKT
jgi:DNA-binding NtrC family response regulator